MYRIFSIRLISNYYLSTALSRHRRFLLYTIQHSGTNKKKILCRRVRSWSIVMHDTMSTRQRELSLSSNINCKIAPEPYSSTLLRSYAKMKFQFEVVIAVAALQTAVAEDHHNLRARRLQCNRCLDSINRVSACESRIGDVKCGACIGEEGSFIDPRSPAPICTHVPLTHTRTFLSLLFSNIYIYILYSVY